jgi:hypothetical protein
MWGSVAKKKKTTKSRNWARVIAKGKRAAAARAKANPRSRGNKTPKSVSGNRKVRRAMKAAGAKVSAQARYHDQRSRNRAHRRKYPQVGPHVSNPPKMKALKKSTGWISAASVKLIKGRGGEPDRVLIRKAPKKRK